MRPLFADPVIIVSVLLAIAKLGDFILRRHQQQRVQDWVETLTLYLDEIKPLNWFQDLSIAKVFKGMLILSLLLLLGTIPLLAGRLHHFGTSYSFLGDLFIASAVTQPFLVWLIGRRLINWLVGNRKAKTLLIRYIALFLGFILVILAAQYIIWVLAWLTLDASESFASFMQHRGSFNHEPTWWLYAIYMAIIPVTTFFGLVLLVGTFPLFDIVILGGTQAFLKLFVGIAYRIVEWKTGAVSAISTILAALLSIADVAVRVGILKDPSAIQEKLMKPMAWFGVFVCASATLAFERMIKVGIYPRWASFVGLGSILMTLVLFGLAIGGDARLWAQLVGPARLSGILIAIGLLGIGISWVVDLKRQKA